MSFLLELFPTTASQVFYLILFVYMILAISSLLMDNEKNASETVAWVFIIIIFPVIGLLVYIVFGRNWRIHNKKIRHKVDQFFEEVHHLNKPRFSHNYKNIRKIGRAYPSYDMNKILSLLHSNLSQVPYGADQVKIISKGEDKFKSLIKDLQSAKEFIHMEYFIWKSSGIYNQQIQKILKDKVKEGVEVRILFDIIGCMTGFKRKDRRDLKKAGVQIWSDFHKFDKINLRNHTKAVIIDGKIGYTGGMNLADEYATGGKRFDQWKDSHLRITGDFVSLIQTIFVTHWFLATKEKLLDKKYFPKTSKTTGIPLQLIYSGPDTKRDHIHETFLSLINSAKKTIHIQSPYFIPDSAISNAIKIAALSGVEVKIILTGCKNVDKHLPYYAAYTYFEELLKVGVQIYHYKTGFYHKKGIIIDSQIVTLGTANMDLRSFKLNNELNVVIFDQVKAIEADKVFRTDLANSKQYTLEKYQKLNYFVKFRNAIARLFSGAL